MSVLKDYLYFIFIVFYSIFIGIFLSIMWLLSKIILGIYAITIGCFASKY